MKAMFGERVTALRKARKIRSTAALAKRVGMSQPSMRAIEQGTSNPAEIKLGNFMSLVEVLQTTPEYLWAGVERSTAALQVAEEILMLAERIARMSTKDRSLLDVVFGKAVDTAKVEAAGYTKRKQGK